MSDDSECETKENFQSVNHAQIQCLSTPFLLLPLSASHLSIHSIYIHVHINAYRQAKRRKNKFMHIYFQFHFYQSICNRLILTLSHEFLYHLHLCRSVQTFSYSYLLTIFGALNLLHTYIPHAALNSAHPFLPQLSFETVIAATTTAFISRYDL